MHLREMGRGDSRNSGEWGRVEGQRGRKGVRERVSD